MQLSESLQQFKQFVVNESSLLIEGLWETPKALLVRLLQEVTKKNILIITTDTKLCQLIENSDYFHISSIQEFPSWDTLPGEEFSPSLDIMGKRLKILYEISQKKKPQVILCPLQSFLQKIPSPALIQSLCKELSVGDHISFSTISDWLSELGYRRSAAVMDKGEFAIRGGIVDVFPPHSLDPYRLEFFGDQIDNIRTFDPIGQKSVQKTTSLLISPASEETILKQQPGISLIAYMGSETVIIFDHLLHLEDKSIALQKLIKNYPQKFSNLNDIFSESKDIQKIYWIQQKIEELSEVQIPSKIGRSYYSRKEPLQPLSFDFFQMTFSSKRWNHPFLPIQNYLPDLSSSSLIPHCICGNEREETIIREKIILPEKVIWERGYLSNGFTLEDMHHIWIPTAEITHRQKVRKEAWRNSYHLEPLETYDLTPGDLIVHFHHGIGKYLGIEKKPNHLGHLVEFMVLEYAEQSKIFVPLTQSYLVSRYIGAKEETPTFHKIGTKNWQKTKMHTQQAIVGYAQDLLKMHAERSFKGGFAFPKDTLEMIQFEEEFPFTVTQDQLQAIEEIKKDMASNKAMDRLLCGDVGYGKTEVAMRAAFKAVVEGKKQVAILVPTTVLALQHYENFCERMKNYPIVIKIVSRFHSIKEIKQSLKALSEGKVDILIGTHRLLSKDVFFKDLGLIIVDEEQRFGVRAKEYLKKIKAGVDCLTMSATPVPRTLYFSLIGAREISLINTPPHDRLPIKTLIIEKDPNLITQALKRELSREGQAYFIHNRVQSIDLIQKELQNLLPEARFVVGHGQMSGEELDTVFHCFKTGQADVLVSTTIIENGIDIPNANTIFIDNAHQFGLGDLYQLRGRVGRSNRPAYAYFIIPNRRELSEISRKRLDTLIEFQGYGSGIKVAMRDLEMRGAGEILGVKQTGDLSNIGYYLYCKLLKKAIEALKKQTTLSFFEAKMEFSYDARIPEEYIDEMSLRLECYHRLGNVSSLEEIEQLFIELQDRFGKPPVPVLWLYHLIRVRIRASQKGFIFLKFNTYSLDTEKQSYQTTVKTSFPLKSFKNPVDLEQYVCQTLHI